MMKDTMDKMNSSRQPIVRMTRDNGVYNFEMKIPRREDNESKIVHRNRWQELASTEEEEADMNPRYDQDVPRLGAELF